MGLSRILNGDYVNSLNTYGISSHMDFFLSGNNMVSAGVSAERLSSELVNVEPISSAKNDGWLLKAKVGYRYTLPYNLSTDLGLQPVFSTFADKLTVNPSFLVNWEPSNVYNTYFSVVQSTPMIREASLSNTLSQPLLDILIPADKSLAISEKLNISLGGRLMPVIGYELKADFFSEAINNPTLVDSGWSGDFSDQDKWLTRYKSGTINGLNLSLEKLTPGLGVLAKYRFSRANLTDTLDVENLLPGHREHEFYLILEGKFRENMGYRADFTLASGKRFMESDQNWAGSPAYHRLDISFYRDVNWDLVEGRVSLRLLNISNASNLEFEETDWVINSLQDRAFVLLPFTPTLNFDFVF